MVVGEAGDHGTAMELVASERPDVLLLDLTFPEGDALPLLRKLRASHPEVRVVVLTMHADPETVRQAVAAGAAGYLVKGAKSRELIEAILAVARGERYLHSSVTGTIVEDSIRWFESGRMSLREREVLSLLAPARRRPRSPTPSISASTPYGGTSEVAGEAGRPRHECVDPVRDPERAGPGGVTTADRPTAAFGGPGLFDDEVRRDVVGHRRVVGLERRPSCRRGSWPRPGCGTTCGGRDDVPRRRGRSRSSKGVVEGGLVVVPALALGEVAHRELPALRRVVVARLEPLRAARPVDRQEELDDRRAVVASGALEGVDLVVARRQTAFGTRSWTRTTRTSS